MVLIGYWGVMHPRVRITGGRGGVEMAMEREGSRWRRHQSHDCQTGEERSCQCRRMTVSNWMQCRRKV